MKHRIIVLLLVWGATTLATLTAHAQSNPWVSAYYAGWNQGYLPPSEIDYSAVTDIIHFALVPQTNGSLDYLSNSISPANSAALVQAAHGAGRKALVCIGGWNTEGGFLGATSGGTMNTFVSNIVSFTTSRGYDGVDIDWEPLNAGDANQYVAFITALRTALDGVSPRPMLTAATGWQPAIIAQVQSKLDQVNIMTYDMSGPWPGWVTWHNSPIYDGGFKFPSTGGYVPSANGMVDDFVSGGIAANKLGIGIDFYGYVWSGGTGTPSGGATAPRQSWSAAPSLQSNVPYYTILQNYYQSANERWDSSAQASYLSFDNAGSTGDMFISYDNENTCRKKVEYARSKGIGGIIIWELGGGYLPGTFPNRDRLLQAVKQAIGGGTPTPALPAPPALAMPLNGTTGMATAATLSWSASTGASSYGLQVASNTSFAPAIVNQSGLVPLSSAVSGLANSTTYYWRVNATNSAGTSAWSSVYSFSTAATAPVAPAAPILAAPANGATDVPTTPSLSWNSSTGASSYRLQISASPAFSTIAADQSGIQGTASSASGLANSTLYYWRVNATNSAGTSGWSTANSFTPAAAQPATSDLWVSQDGLLAPWIDASWGATVDFSNSEQHYSGATSMKVVQSAWGGLSVHSGNWGAPVNVNTSSYSSVKLAIFSPSGGVSLSLLFENELGTAFPRVSYGAPAAGQWVQVSIPMSQLNPGGQVVSRLDIMDMSGSAQTFYVDDVRFGGTAVASVPSVPALSAPVSGASNVATNPTLAWSASTGASSYRLQLSVRTDFSSTALDQSGIAATQATAPGLATGTTYYWRVNATNSAGTSGWSNTFSFATQASAPNAPPVPTLVSPGNGASKVSGSTTLTWNPAAGASSYHLQVSASSAFSGLVSDQAALTAASFALTGLSSNTTYYWRVNASNAGGTSSWSAVWSFRTSNRRTFVSAYGTASVQQVEEGIPQSYALSQNFPNPFNPSTTIRFELPEAGHATLKVYNSLGQEVATLLDGELGAGTFQAVWNAGGMPSGTYFYRLDAGSFTQSKKLVLLK